MQIYAVGDNIKNKTITFIVCENYAIDINVF